MEVPGGCQIPDPSPFPQICNLTLSEVTDGVVASLLTREEPVCSIVVPPRVQARPPLSILFQFLAAALCSPAETLLRLR